MNYLVLKTLHIITATIFLGAGAMIAWFNLRAARTKDRKLIAWYSREIVLADKLFTTPTAVLLPLTGVWMVLKIRLPWTTPWILFGILGFLATGILWLPAVWLQIQMRQTAERAEREDTPLPDHYWRHLRYWRWLGYPAFTLAVAIIWVMVTKRVGW